MTQNPFDGLGGGNLDLGALLQQAERIREDLQAAQSQLAETSVEGTVAGGIVSVTVSGAGELTGVTIRPDAFGDEGVDLGETLTDLGDLIVAAYRDARAKSDALAKQTLGPLAGGLPGFPADDSGDGPPISGRLGF